METWLQRSVTVPNSERALWHHKSSKLGPACCAPLILAFIHIFMPGALTQSGIESGWSLAEKSHCLCCAWLDSLDSPCRAHSKPCFVSLELPWIVSVLRRSCRHGSWRMRCMQRPCSPSFWQDGHTCFDLTLPPCLGMREVCFIQISVDSSKGWMPPLMPPRTCRAEHFLPGEKYLADLAAHRGMTLEASRNLISEYQDLAPTPCASSCGFWDALFLAHGTH